MSLLLRFTTPPIRQKASNSDCILYVMPSTYVAGLASLCHLSKLLCNGSSNMIWKRITLGCVFEQCANTLFQYLQVGKHGREQSRCRSQTSICILWRNQRC